MVQDKGGQTASKQSQVPRNLPYHRPNPVRASWSRRTALASCPRAARGDAALPAQRASPAAVAPGRRSSAWAGPGRSHARFPPTPSTAPPGRAPGPSCPPVPLAGAPPPRSRAPQPGPRLPSCRRLPPRTDLLGGTGPARSGPCARRLPPPLPAVASGCPAAARARHRHRQGKGPGPPPPRPPPAPLRRRGRGPRAAEPGCSPRLTVPGPGPVPGVAVASRPETGSGSPRRSAYRAPRGIRAGRRGRGGGPGARSGERAGSCRQNAWVRGLRVSGYFWV